MEAMIPLFAIVCIWLVPCAFVGMISDKNGHGFWLVFFLSIFLSPIIIGIAVLCMGKTTEKKIEEARAIKEAIG